MLAGLTAKSRPVRSLTPAATVDLHRFLSLLSLMAVALHGAFLALDTSVPIPVVALLVPGTSPFSARARARARAARARARARAMAMAMAMGGHGRP